MLGERNQAAIEVWLLAKNASTYARSAAEMCQVGPYPARCGRPSNGMACTTAMLIEGCPRLIANLGTRQERRQILDVSTIFRSRLERQRGHQNSSSNVTRRNTPRMPPRNRPDPKGM